MTDVRTALVIGGGVAGPVAAMALRKAGIEATVYEAYEGTADGVGGGLGLATNGLNALKIIGVDDAVRAAGVPVSAMVIESWTGKRLAEFGVTAGPPVLYSVWRTDLYRTLYDQAAAQGIRIEHGKRLTRATEHADGVTASFADGTTASADILIGADGVRSTVRSLIDPTAPAPGYTGLLGFGGFVEADAGVGLPSTSGAMHMCFGKKAFFGYLVEPSGRIGWFANLPSKQQLTVEEANAVGGVEWLRQLTDAFAGDRTPARAILDGVAPERMVIVGGLEIMRSAPVWSRGRMVIVGDAAHVPSNSSGQGASMAVEGAVELARCLRDLPTLAEAFATYDRLRRPRIDRIIAGAERNNNHKAAGPVARILRDLTMPTMMKLLAKPERMAWQNDYLIDWDAPVQSVPTPALAGK
ncbi:MAG TPA: NAD(P)/FAD-dependent oxidoreductase [Pseudonocardiaceae bacterium]|jgi:2-polyprenyl-6-methoxyphenol hydroxylase-like FAD-dependent oxidoreductase|nr:NAD(P)/FAD-dependent oxidoreductase [Pseudonocardiaceae bacterium]